MPPELDGAVPSRRDSTASRRSACPVRCSPRAESYERFRASSRFSEGASPRAVVHPSRGPATMRGLASRAPSGPSLHRRPSVCHDMSVLLDDWACGVAEPVGGACPLPGPPVPLGGPPCGITELNAARTLLSERPSFWRAWRTSRRARRSGRAGCGLWLRGARCLERGGEGRSRSRRASSRAPRVSNGCPAERRSVPCPASARRASCPEAPGRSAWCLAVRPAWQPSRRWWCSCTARDGVAAAMASAAVARRADGWEIVMGWVPSWCGRAAGPCRP